MAAITASELLHGVHRADTAVRRERRLHHVQAILGAVSILPFDFEGAEVHARIWADLAARGQLIGARSHQHGALKKGFSSLYGYSSDEGGIRHAMLKEPNLTAVDANYFLLSCTSFINYLKAKL